MNAPNHPPPDATSRFSSRVENYVRYRPGYPPAVVELLAAEAGLRAGAVVADIGSGTGIFTRLLLEAGAEVFAVEPNDGMRTVAEAAFAGDPRFHPVRATGEDTRLADHSVDLIVAAQAFHWFDRRRARAEFDRILKPGGRIALIWNVRQTESTAFLREYEHLLLTFAPEYGTVRHENVDTEVLTEFFGGGSFRKHSFPNAQSFDFPALCGRVLSSSYAPAAGHPLHDPMMAELRRIFDAHHENGTVAFLYSTEVFLGC